MPPRYTTAASPPPRRRPTSAATQPLSASQRRKRTRGLLTAAAIAGGVLVVGYAVVQSNRRDGDPTAACVLVIDKTTSTSDAVTLTDYGENGHRAIAGCRERGAALEIYSFDDTTTMLVLESATSLNLKRRSRSDEAGRIVDQVLARTAVGKLGSDIIAPLGEAAQHLKALANEVGRGEQFLILLTDGYQISNDLSIEALTDDVGSAQPLIARAAAFQLDLHDDQISVIGVKSGAEVAPDAGHVDDAFERSIQAFWIGVIDQAGGRLCAYLYESTRLPATC